MRRRAGVARSGQLALALPATDHVLITALAIPHRQRAAHATACHEGRWRKGRPSPFSGNRGALVRHSVRSRR
jgi:hypothetical protein